MIAPRRPPERRAGGPAGRSGLHGSDWRWDDGGELGPQGSRILGRRDPRAGRRSSASTATRRSSRSAITTRCWASWPTTACRRTIRTGASARRYEKTKTMYDHGVSGLPYEMVINSDPCLAYLMRDNSLCLQILTIAHVYGHNDFFKQQLHLHERDPGRAHAGSVQDAGRPRARLRGGPLDRHRAGRGPDRCGARAVDELPAQPGDPQAQSREEQRQRRIEAARAAARPVRAAASPAGLRRARSAPGAARAGGGHPAVHPRPQPPSRGAGSRTC